jgi:protein O-GlcNAc transferase
VADPRLKPVETALAARDAGAAAKALDAALRAGARPPPAPFAALSASLLAQGAVQSAEGWARRGLDLHPRSPELWLTLGVALRRIQRLDEAVHALTRARGLAPGQPSIGFNLANVHNDRGDGAAAEAELAPLIRAQPKDVELRHMLARAKRHQGDLDGADAALAEALRLDPKFVGAWRDRAMLASERQRHDEALSILSEAAKRLPDEARLAERRAEILLRAGRLDDARAELEAEIAARPDAAWPRHQLARLLLETDLAAALAHAEAAAAAAPRDASVAVTLAQARHHAAQNGRPEHLQGAYDLAKALASRGPPPAEHVFAIRSILAQTADVDGARGVGDFTALGRYWALNGHHPAFLSQLPLADTPERRRELLSQHRLWAAPIERRAAASPVRRPPRSDGGKLRVGFLSSDLRRHPVGYFAQGLFEHYDRGRFELFVYSFYPHAADDVQARIAGQIAGFRSLAGFSEHGAAQRIADDGLDVLIELGATTRHNFAQVMAYRPAPVQASWLGYPHSVGLTAIDHLILDPYAAPLASGLLVERPLQMPRTWIALNRGAFRDEPSVARRAGGAPVTFGTANSPHKYTRAALETWARVVAAAPGARFLFLRPEAAAPAFRANVSRIFSEGGVDPARIDFEPVVSGHLRHYRRMDVSLDTFPVTGGTTTCESLWMGVPVVSLRGEAVFQRLSHSILTNAGLGDLSLETVDEYVARAIELAQDAPRLAALRGGLRDQLKASPLGDETGFARDFFELIERAAAGA